MTVVIAGGTGFLGRPLAAALLEEGHQVVVLSRTAAAHVPPGARAVAWRPDGGRSSWAGAFDVADAVISLAG
jgi:nucleoside-diphosphate-sugar epimerase